jgi:hypothetical protein
MDRIKSCGRMYTVPSIETVAKYLNVLLGLAYSLILSSYLGKRCASIQRMCVCVCVCVCVVELG